MEIAASKPASAAGNSACSFEVAAPEMQAAADVVLPEPRLRLVHAHARGVGEQRAVQLAREALVVERMAALVQRREDRAQRIVGTRADRESHVVLAGHHRERMRRAIEPAALEVEAHVREQRRAESRWRCSSNGPRGSSDRIGGCARPAPAPGSRSRRRGTEQRLEPRAAHAGLVLVEQRVVEIVGQLQRLRALAHELQQGPERSGERRKSSLRRASSQAARQCERVSANAATRLAGKATAARRNRSSS